MYRYFENNITDCIGFPTSFLWGSATAGHQVEGNNVNSDIWFLENVTPSVFRERSGDACNSYELWQDDVDLAIQLGFSCYRFSIEWARIEPTRGSYSEAAALHYKNIIDYCRQHQIKPILTFCHFSSPLWFAANGGWTNPEAPMLFARYCEFLTSRLCDHIDYVMTLNEPNILRILSSLGVPDEVWNLQEIMLEATERQLNCNKYSVINATRKKDFDTIQKYLIEGHKLAREAIKRLKPDIQVGFSLAVIDEQAVTKHSVCEQKRQFNYGAWLDAAQHADFIGVQNYERLEWNDTGIQAPHANAIINQLHQWIEPTSLANSVAYIYERTHKPIFITEHGVATDDDVLREEFIPASLKYLKEKIDSGIPVLGYIHWTLIDNFEWVSGFKSHFGLCSVNRKTFQRTIKNSAYIYKKIIEQNRLV